jgi:hypothetical protein
MTKNDMTINDAMEINNRWEEYRKKQINLTVDLSAKIKKNLSTKKVSYNDYREAFDYVGKIFPDIEVKDIDVRLATPILLKKLGYNGIGGFFERISKTVIVSSYQLVSNDFNKNSVKAKLNKDEIIVHELLHYCHDVIGSNSSVNLKEEFAYGWSLGYLRGKGYTDEEIVKDNYLPYLYKVCSEDGYKNILRSEEISLEELKRSSRVHREKVFNSRLRSKIHKEILELSTVKGKEIIRIYDKKIKEGKPYRCINKSKNTVFDVLDLE